MSQRQGPNQAPVARPRESSPTSSMGPWAGPALPAPSPGLCPPPACLCPPGSWTDLWPHLLGSPLEPGFFWGPLRLDPHPSPSCLAQGGAGGLLGSCGGGQREVLHLQPPLALGLVPRLLLFQELFGQLGGGGRAEGVMMPTQSSFSALQPDEPGTYRPGPRTPGGSGVGVYKHGSYPTDKLAAAPLWLVLAVSRAERGRVEGT